MHRLKIPNISALEIAGYLNSTLKGEDFFVSYPSSVNNFLDNSIFYLSDSEAFPHERIKKYKHVLILTTKKLDNPGEHFSYILTNYPKLDFIRVINEFFIEADIPQISLSAKIHHDAQIGRNVSIGENTIIGPNVRIGDNTQILNNVVITSRVEIGKDCIIKDNSTIGSEGFDFEIDEKGNPVHFPHVGKIIIGNKVWIGSNTSIESAKIENSIISDFVKIDDLVHIGYDCSIGNRTLITAGVIINRNVTIKEDTLIAPNACIREKIIIGKNVIIGEGTVVVKNIKDNSIYVGNPAHFLKDKE